MSDPPPGVRDRRRGAAARTVTGAPGIRARRAVAAAMLAAVPLLVPPSGQGQSAFPDVAGRASDAVLAGLEWTFARIRYGSPPDRLAEFRRIYWSDPWAIDGPAAEQNLSRRMGRVTTIVVNEPVILELGDEALWDHPWIYFVEPANIEFTEAEVGILREFLLRGGTATLDDFHGPVEWDLVERQMARVFPDRPFVDLDPQHPIFSCFYQLDAYPQIPGLGSFFNNVTWEKGGFDPHLRAILDDDGRAMVLANFNTDMGDGWEWSNAEEYPGYIRYTAQSYRMMINEIVYALTH
ncbi:MAG: DUF4159 domain-containing protein [Acidobacteria bacterium]|nr:DUF4159 domain-containing protein [Acidobacteriota bacterium]